ncbi:GNAT family N-acetyltransferase [Acetobacterium malicum]|uniref:GNAT family N-acetyltransferase n=1 Tax=Acetobacterium malicum TaxID=52692 RepID=UPI00164CAB69|nr:GNAT family N-acetyltransferase [Acetobacterium malicum]
MTEKIGLRRFQTEDLGIFKEWLKKDHVKKWYTEPDDWIAEVTLRGSSFSWITHFIVEWEERPIGFGQFYKCLDAKEEWYANVPQTGTYSIDYLIGEREFLGKGYGKKTVQLLTEMIFRLSDSKRIVVQPEPENRGSCNALLANGYLFDEANGVYQKEK